MMLRQRSSISKHPATRVQTFALLTAVTLAFVRLRAPSPPRPRHGRVNSMTVGQAPTLAVLV